MSSTLVLEGTMSRSIPDELAALPLGEGALIHGVRVTRRSLFGFEVGGAPQLLDAAAAAARLGDPSRWVRKRPHTPGSTGTLAKGGAVRIALCFRCAGDGLGRRDRGVCAVCHGRGIQVVEPAAGWADASPAQIAAAVDQASLALRDAHHAQAREALTALLAILAPRAMGVLRKSAGPSPATSLPGNNAA